MPSINDKPLAAHAMLACIPDLPQRWHLHYCRFGDLASRRTTAQELDQLTTALLKKKTREPRASRRRC
jgi:hypothetical protein